MPNHKLTLLGHPAFKAAQQYLQFNQAPSLTTRVAFADGVLAISGGTGPRLPAGAFALQQYKVDFSCAGPGPALQCDDQGIQRQEVRSLGDR